MFERILYPTDFSSVAQKALKYIDRLRYAGAKEVVILHIIDTRSLEIMDWDPFNYRSAEGDLRKRAEENSIFLKKHLEKIGFRVRVRIETGVPVKKILDIAREEDSSVIVIGSHGSSNVRDMIMGSVSERVTRNARRTVIVVKR